MGKYQHLNLAARAIHPNLMLKILHHMDLQNSQPPLLGLCVAQCGWFYSSKGEITPESKLWGDPVSGYECNLLRLAYNTKLVFNLRWYSHSVTESSRLCRKKISQEFLHPDTWWAQTLLGKSSSCWANRSHTCYPSQFQCPWQTWPINASTPMSPTWIQNPSNSTPGRTTLHLGQNWPLQWNPLCFV